MRRISYVLKTYEKKQFSHVLLCDQVEEKIEVAENEISSKKKNH